MKTTDTVEQLAALNLFNQNFHFKTADYFNKESFDLKNESDLMREIVTKDFQLLKEYEKAFLSRGGSLPIVGDALLLPTGETVYFSHIWDDHAQTTGGGSNSLLSSGFISYSGGLDSGVKIDDIYLSDEFTCLNIWFCHRGYLTGGCAVYAYIKTRVWKCKENADLSGVPQIERFYEKIEEDKAETITRINGNGQEYTKPVPKIQTFGLTDEQNAQISKILGIEFKKWGAGYHKAQLMTVKQFEAAQNLKDFSVEYHDGSFWTNTLLITKK